MSAAHVMKVSANGQVSIPADVRARWHPTRVIVVDLGDRIVIRPMPDDPVAAFEGKYHGKGPTSDDARHQGRTDDAATESRRSA